MKIFLHYIYKQFKLSFILTIMLFLYIIVYVEGVVAYRNAGFTSEKALLAIQSNYITAAFDIEVENDIQAQTMVETAVATKVSPSAQETISETHHASSNKYNSEGGDYSISVEKLGITEELFDFPMTFNQEDYELENSKKDDENMIDFELMDSADISKGFLIGGHSSGYWTDNSHLKNVFASLDLLEENDEVTLTRNTGEEIKYVVSSKYVLELSESLLLDNKYYIYTCYPIGTTDKRLIIELEEVIL